MGADRKHCQSMYRQLLMYLTKATPGSLFTRTKPSYCFTWWRHQMETLSASLALCARNSPVTGEFPSQKPVTRSFDAFFDLRLDKRLGEQLWGWWFETPSRTLWLRTRSRPVVPSRAASNNCAFPLTYDKCESYSVLGDSLNIQDYEGLSREAKYISLGA